MALVLTGPRFFERIWLNDLFVHEFVERLGGLRYLAHETLICESDDICVDCYTVKKAVEVTADTSSRALTPVLLAFLCRTSIDSRSQWGIQSWRPALC